MNKNDQHQSGNGFLLGFILGLLVMFLLATKKGRELLAQFAKQGEEKLNEIKEMADVDAMLEEEEDADFIPQQYSMHTTTPSEKHPTQGRRFFRRHKKA